MTEFDKLEETDVLDFEDDQLPELPDDNPFDNGQTKKPWLLVGVGVIALTLIIVVVLKLTTGIGQNESGLIELPIDRDIESLVADSDLAKPQNAVPESTAPAGMPERVVDKRPDVKFDPDKPSVARPKPRPVTQAKPTVQQKAGSCSVQVGSYNTRAVAESAQKTLQTRHASLFGGQSFAVLEAVLPNGNTTHRLRVVGFASCGEADSFCRNAKSDGVDCYVTK